MSTSTSKGLRVTRDEPSASEAVLPHQEPRVYTIEEAAAELRVSERHVRRLVKTGQLRAKKCGSRVLIIGRDLWAYIEGLPSATMR